MIPGQLHINYLKVQVLQTDFPIKAPGTYIVILQNVQIPFSLMSDVQVLTLSRYFHQFQCETDCCQVAQGKQ